MVSYLIHCDSLLQNATDIITKCDRYFITKCDKSLLQNASGFLLQNATVLLQNATVITKCDVYYKLRQYTEDSLYDRKACYRVEIVFIPPLQTYLFRIKTLLLFFNKANLELQKMNEWFKAYKLSLNTTNQCFPYAIKVLRNITCP